MAPTSSRRYLPPLLAFPAAEPAAEGLWTEAVGLPADPQDAHVSRLEPERLQALREPGGGVSPYLREEEGEPPGRVRRTGLRARSGHSFLGKIVIDCND